MKYSVTVKVRAHKEEVIQIDPTHFKISVKEPPIEGKANEAIERALAEYLDIAPSRVQVVSGHTVKRKILEVF